MAEKLITRNINKCQKNYSTKNISINRVLEKLLRKIKLKFYHLKGILLKLNYSEIIYFVYLNVKHSIMPVNKS